MFEKPAVLRRVCRRACALVACSRDRATLVLAVISAICAGLALRQLAIAAALLLPYDSWASEIAHQAAYLPRESYWAAAGIAALGGVASLFHELRTDPTRFSILNAFGHMTSAQFAGLTLYLLAVNWEWSWPLTLAASGIAGWGGNKLVSALNDALIKRLASQIENGPLK